MQSHGFNEQPITIIIFSNFMFIYIYIVSHPLHEPNLQQIPAIKVLPKPNEVEQCELQIGVDRRLTDSSLWHQTWDVFVCLNSWGVVGFK